MPKLEQMRGATVRSAQQGSGRGGAHAEEDGVDVGVDDVHPDADVDHHEHRQQDEVEHVVLHEPHRIHRRQPVQLARSRRRLAPPPAEHGAGDREDARQHRGRVALERLALRHLALRVRGLHGKQRAEPEQRHRQDHRVLHPVQLVQPAVRPPVCLLPPPASTRSTAMFSSAHRLRTIGAGESHGKSGWRTHASSIFVCCPSCALRCLGDTSIGPVLCCDSLTALRRRSTGPESRTKGGLTCQSSNDDQI